MYSSWQLLSSFVVTVLVCLECIPRPPTDPHPRLVGRRFINARPQQEASHSAKNHYSSQIGYSTTTLQRPTLHPQHSPLSIVDTNQITWPLSLSSSFTSSPLYIYLHLHSCTVLLPNKRTQISTEQAIPFSVVRPHSSSEYSRRTSCAGS